MKQRPALDVPDDGRTIRVGRDRAPPVGGDGKPAHAAVLGRRKHMLGAAVGNRAQHDLAVVTGRQRMRAVRQHRHGARAALVPADIAQDVGVADIPEFYGAVDAGAEKVLPTRRHRQPLDRLDVAVFLAGWDRLCRLQRGALLRSLRAGFGLLLFTLFLTRFAFAGFCFSWSSQSCFICRTAALQSSIRFLEGLLPPVLVPGIEPATAIGDDESETGKRECEKKKLPQPAARILPVQACLGRGNA